MSLIVSKAGIHSVGGKRDGYGPFVQTINAAGRQLAGVKCRDDFGAIDEPLKLWPDLLTVGAKTAWDGGPFDVELAVQRISEQHALNPKIRYWEYLNEIDGIYDQQADFYIAIMPRLKALGIGLGLFSCASGTPQYPWSTLRSMPRVRAMVRNVQLAIKTRSTTSYILRRLAGQSETPYEALARACRFARNNEIDAVLCLHEYVSAGGMMGRWRVLADYLAQHAALIPIVISEWLFETHPGDTAFMRGVIENDPIYIDDPRVLFCATWTLGGGGWAGSNYQTALPQLGEYIATVHDPDNGVLPVSFVFGVHATASPGPMLAGDASGITTAAKFNGYKFLTGDPPEHYAQVAALGLAHVNNLTRLFVDFTGQPKPTAAKFCDDQRLAITEAMTAGVQYFEIHNEPNIPQEWPYSTDPHDFIRWLLQVIAQLRLNHPGIKLVSPGLSPQPNTPTWWTEFADHGVFGACEAIGAHVYWPNGATMLTLAQGLNFIPLEPYASTSKPIFITEFSNNQTTDADSVKGAQYVEWAAYIQAHHPLVTRAYCYIISSGTASDNTTRQSIVRGGVVSAIATGIRDAVPAPAVQYEFEHFHLDGGAATTANPITITMSRDHALQADAIEVAPPVQRFKLTVAISPPGSLIVTLDPPQPVDGYLAGTVVTATAVAA